MNLIPIFARELRSPLHRERVRRERFGVALTLGAALMVWLVFDWWVSGVRWAGLLASAPLLVLAPFVCFTAGLGFGARLLADEWREGTLPLLLLTRLSGFDLVLGKLLHAVTMQAYLILAALPAAVLPLIVAGCSPIQTAMVTLACWNIVFFAMTLRLLVSAMGDRRALKEWCLFLSMVFLLAAPAGRLVPGGQARGLLTALQWFNPGNPCEALSHALTAASGFRPGAYWWPLLASHAVAWALAGVAGWVLFSCVRRQAGLDLGARRMKWWQRWRGWMDARSPAWRARMLDRNAWEWLMSRERRPTIAVWIGLTISVVGFGWLAWVCRGLGVPAYHVMAMGAGSCWHLVLFVLAPSEASRRLVQDRQNGMLELVLITPLGVKHLVRGLWRAIRRRFLAPTLTVMLLNTALMIAGYVTSGFGGMSTSECGLWLFWWLAGIVMLPLQLIAVCWTALRRTLVAQQAGEAAAVAMVIVLGLPAILLQLLYWTGVWAGVDLSWAWAAGLLTAAYGAILALMAWRARRVFLAGLRSSSGGELDGTTSETSSGTSGWLWFRKERTSST